MELVGVYVGLQKARRWNKDKVNYLPGAYGSALKYIYGEEYVHVDLVKNQSLVSRRVEGEVVKYYTELV